MRHRLLVFAMVVVGTATSEGWAQSPEASPKAPFPQWRIEPKAPAQVPVQPWRIELPSCDDLNSSVSKAYFEDYFQCSGIGFTRQPEHCIALSRKLIELGTAYLAHLDRCPKLSPDYARSIIRNAESNIKLQQEYIATQAQQRSGASPVGQTQSSLEDFQVCARFEDPWRVRRHACDLVVDDASAVPERRAFALSERARAHISQASYADAIADLTRAIDLDPAIALYHQTRAVAYRGARQLAKALGDVDKAIELDATFASAHYQRGLIHTDLNDDRAAIADFTKAIEFNRKDADAWVERGGAKQRLGDRAGARADLAHAIGLKPSYAAYFYLGQIFSTENAMREAISYFDRAIELDPRRHEAYASRGREYLRLIKPDEAIRDLTKAIELSPDDASHANRAACYLLKRQFKEALADATKAVALNPRSANAFNARGLAHAGLGQKQAAISDYRMALSLEPAHQAARTNLKLLGVNP